MNSDDLYFKPHQNLATWANTDCSNTSSLLNNPYEDYANTNCKKEVKYAKQKERIKNLKKRILAKPTEDVTAIKGVIIEELTSLSNQLISLEQINQKLVIENKELKEALKHKDDILLQFQEIVLDSTEKFKQLEQLNEELRAQIKTQEKVSIETVKDQRLNNEKEISVLNDKIASLENDNELLSEEIKSYQHKEIETNGLYESFKDIQNEIKNLEETYSRNIDEKGEYINELKKEIDAFSEDKQEYTNTVDELMKENEVLQYKINLLEREKEILLQEKAQDHQEIIHLRENYEWDKGNKAYRSNQNILNDESLCEVFERKENEYMKEITTLHGIILDRENEIETIKHKLFDKIHDLSLEKERLEMRLNENHIQTISKYKRDTVDSYLYE